MPLEAFERALEEELSLSAEFDLPLTLLSVRARAGLDPETTRRLLGVFRTAEFVTQPTDTEDGTAQDGDAHPRLHQASGDDRPRGASSHDEHVRSLGHGGRR